jgi:hypothetical protein
MTTTKETLRLAGNQLLVLERGPSEGLLKIVNPSGQISLSVHITAAGPVLRFEGPGLVIQAAGALAIDAEYVGIRGREGVAISSGGDATVQVAGDLDMQARAHRISALLGDVSVQANDDVRMNGERVLMNCD